MLYTIRFVLYNTIKTSTVRVYSEICVLFDCKCTVFFIEENKHDLTIT